MFGRIFGRSKDEPEEAVCAMCGRTLLAGEWTRRITTANGEERLVCSLCGPDLPLDEDEPPADPPPLVLDDKNELLEEQASQDDRETVGESGARDLEMAELRERLTQSELHNQELTRELEQVRAELAQAVADRPDVVVDDAHDVSPLQPEDAETDAEADQPLDSSEPGERTWGETPAEFAALSEEAGSPPEPEESSESAPVSLDETQPIPTVDLPADESDTATADETIDVASEEEAQAEPTVESGNGEVADEGRPLAEDDAVAPSELSQEPEAEPEPQWDVATLALLQRGVDLFNVSRVPRRIAETNEQLGTPTVHVLPEEPTVAVTFMWSMGWYLFHVETESGEVSMADRGYDEITEATPNAEVRPDGTIHLAPARISRAAAQRYQDEAGAGKPGERTAGEPETPSSAAQKAPEILSKSLLGQRSDDGPADWEKAKARDFDWER